MTLHSFQPTRYYNSFGSHPVALRIRSGDSVETAAIDAHGVDALGRQAADKPNPLTGPFHVAGAEPGDTLAVRLDRLSPDRANGFSRDVLAADVVGARVALTLPEVQHIDWRIDPARGTAELTQPLQGLGRLSLPLAPMLGCLGVAPEGGQAISSATSGEYGGNMDYRGLRRGATVYFPVFVPGALLFLGDGHAVQGAGEVIGTGVETSFTVQLTVSLLKGKRAGWPRGEDAQSIFTLGNARPLDSALQHATGEMLAWLVADYGMDARSASTLLGMCVEYEIGNVFDPAYTVVCKLAKNVLGRN